MSMNEHDDPALRRESFRQNSAEQPARAGETAQDPVVNRYRYIYHVLRKSAPEGPPDDFAAQMEQMTRDYEESAAFESWTLRLIGVLAALTLLAVGVPIVANMLPVLRHWLARMPWPLALVVASSLGLAWVLDRWLHHRFPSEKGTE